MANQLLKSLRFWFWRVAGNWIAGVALYLLGHSMHWRERHLRLNDHGPVQAFQRGMATLAIAVGVAYLLTGKGQAASPLADLLDRTAFHPGLWPHQWLGLILTISSALLFVAIYEWPVKSEWSAEDPATEEMTNRRIRSLIFMQLAGHMVALCYWGMTGLLLLFACHTSALGWGSMAFCLIHRQLYIRNNREYEKELGEIRRWRVRIARAKALLTMHLKNAEALQGRLSQEEMSQDRMLQAEAGH